ncbi:hypothetical protein GGS24DRAFT_498736 [Hypoxylon argillaceum]|nr:hypothetical protein GGS24DRAFT_498736 [Hypoxylon argillaceum]
MDKLPPSSDDRAPGIVACCIASIVVPSIAVALRLWSRGVAASLTFWWDDVAILVTLVFSHAFLAITLYWTTIGLGKHSRTIPVDLVNLNNNVNRVTLVFYSACILLLKLSALLLYARIFKSSPAFRRASWIIGVILTLWWAILTIVPWLFCHPIEKSLNIFLPGTCDHPISWYYISALLNFVADLVVLIMPTPIIWKLQMTLRKKISISLVFLIGYVSAFLSFARFIIIVHDPSILNGGQDADPSWDLVPLLYLSLLEAPVAIIALCAPSISQLVARAVEQKALSSLFHSRPQSTSRGSSSMERKVSDNSNGSGIVPLDSSANRSWISRPKWANASHTTTISATRTLDEDGNQFESGGVTLGAIHVKDRYDVVHRQV